jgi:hypothetical protein
MPFPYGDNHRVNDLCLSVISNGKLYERCKQLGADTLHNRSRYSTATWWVDLVWDQARMHELQFKLEEKFTVEDILKTATILAFVYREGALELEQDNEA